MKRYAYAAAAFALGLLLCAPASADLIPAEVEEEAAVTAEPGQAGDGTGAEDALQSRGTVVQTDIPGVELIVPVKPAAAEGEEDEKDEPSAQLIVPVKPGAKDDEKKDDEEDADGASDQKPADSGAQLIVPDKADAQSDEKKDEEQGEDKKEEEKPEEQVILAAPKLASLTVRNVELLSPKSPETEKKGSISGKVDVDSDTAEVTVTLTCEDPIVIKTATCTKADPDFEFKDLDAGTYTLTVYYKGIDAPVLTLTKVIGTDEEEKPETPEETPIAITGITAGENEIVVKGKAKPEADITGGTEPASVEASVKSDKSGAFEATLICSAKTYTAVWAQYGKDKTSRTKLEGKFEVTDEELEKYPVFRRGDRYHMLIYRLQQRLRDLGYYTIAVDGIYGSGTERAVRLFQKENGLKATGIADSATQKLLYSKEAKPYHGHIPGGTGYTLYRSAYYQPAVVPLQRRLRELGYYSGSVDGYFGSGTTRAVRNFQSRNGLPVTGAADPQTQARLYSASAVAAGGSHGSGGGSYAPSYRLLYWGCKGDDVRRLQRALLNAGYTQVRTADGIYGRWTYDAVRAFQRDHGLAVDGIAGRRTQNALYGY